MTDTQLSPTVSPLAKVPGETRSIFRSFFSSLRGIALVYLVALTLSEALTTLIEPRVGLAMHGLVLVTLLLHASLGVQGVTRRFLLCLALAPTIRLLSLSLPLPSFPFVYWYMVVGLPLFMAAVVAARLGRMSKGMLGLNLRRLPVQLLVAVTGIGLGYLEYRILSPAALIDGLSWQLILVPAFILLVFTGFLEELIFRGLMQYSALRSLGRIGIWYVALLFTALHLGYHSVVDLIFVFGVALYFAWITQRTGSIFGVTLAHGLTNIGLYLVFPFLLAAPISSPATLPAQGTPLPSQTARPVQPGPGLLAPLPTSQATRPWLPPSPTVLPSASQTPTQISATSSAWPTSTPSKTPKPSKTPGSKTSTPEPSTAGCQSPAGWPVYIVRPGDTLFSLSLTLGISVQELQSANCLTSETLYAGQSLYVPFLPNPVQPSRTPKPTSRPSRTPLPPSRTPTHPPPTNTRVPPTATFVPPRNTKVPPTHTTVPPTNTPFPPTDTPLPPSDTPVPPTAPPRPPKDTLPPPTVTSILVTAISRN